MAEVSVGVVFQIFAPEAVRGSYMWVFRESKALGQQLCSCCRLIGAETQRVNSLGALTERAGDLLDWSTDICQSGDPDARERIAAGTDGMKWCPARVFVFTCVIHTQRDSPVEHHAANHSVTFVGDGNPENGSVFGNGI